MPKPKGICETELSEEQQLKLIDWLINEAIEYRPAAARIEAEFGVKCSKDAVKTFYDNVCWPLVLERRSRARDQASRLEATLEEDERIETAMLSQLKQRAFEIMLKPNPDPKEVVALLSMALKARDQKLDQAKLAQEKSKFDLMLRKYEDQLAKVREIATAAQAKGGLTPETLAKIAEAAKLL
jgi:hypothetical protein